MEAKDLTDDILYEVISEVCSPDELGLIYLHYYKGVSLTMSSASVGKTHYTHAKNKLDLAMKRVYRYLEYRELRAFVYYYIKELLTSLWQRTNNKEFLTIVVVTFMTFMGYNRDLIKCRLDIDSQKERSIRFRVRERLKDTELDFFGSKILEALE